MFLQFTNTLSNAVFEVVIAVVGYRLVNSKAAAKAFSRAVDKVAGEDKNK